MINKIEIKYMNTKILNREKIKLWELNEKM